MGVKTVTIILAFVALLLASCRNTTPENVTRKVSADSTTSRTFKKDSIKLPKRFVFSAIDSLNKYKDSTYYVIVRDTEYYGYYRANFYIGKANEMTFGIAPITDSTSAFFQKNSAEWVKQDVLPVGFYLGNVQLVHLNDNHFTDIIIGSSNGYGMSGNPMYLIFFFNKRKEKFIYYRSSNIYNIYYDTVKHLIGSEWYPTNATEGYKELFKIKNDSLIFLNAVAIGLGLGSYDHYPYLRYYIRKGNEEFTIKRVSYKGWKEDSFESIYMHTFWNSE